MKKFVIILVLIALTGCQKQATQNPEGNIKITPTNLSIDNTDETDTKNSKIPEVVRSHFKQGNYFLTRSDYSNAIRKFLVVIKMKPDFAQAYYNLGVAYYETSRTEQAIEEWNKTLKIDPEYTKAYLSLGYAYEQLSNNTQAVEFYDKYLQLKPDDPNAKKIMTKINLLRGQVKGEGIIGRVIITEKIDPEKKLAIKPKDIFSDTISVVYTTAEVGDAPKNTSIKASWYYQGLKNEDILVNSKEKIITGPQNMVFEIKKPENKPWPAGRYEIRLYVNGKENLSVPFTILKEEAKPDAPGQNP